MVVVAAFAAHAAALASWEIEVDASVAFDAAAEALSAVRLAGLD